MAQQLREKIGSYTECAICGSNYTRPKHLQPCLHIFCENCIEQWAHHQAYGGSFPCPLCKADVQIPPGGVKNFPTSFLINNIVDDLNKISPNERPCGVHPDEMLNLICKQCNLYICADCIGDHPSHSIKSLKTEKKSVTESIGKKVELAKSKVEELNIIAEKIRSTIGNYEADYSGGTEAVTVIMLKVQKLCRDKMAKIAEECEPERQRLHEHLTEVDDSIQELNKLIEKASNVASEADLSLLKNDQELLKTFEEVMKREHNADIEPTLKVTTNKGTTLKQIEQLVDKMVIVEEIGGTEGEEMYDSKEYAKAGPVSESKRSQKNEESHKRKNEEAERPGSSRGGAMAAVESDNNKSSKKVNFEESPDRDERSSSRSHGTTSASPVDEQAAYFATAKQADKIKKIHEFDPGMDVNDITVNETGNIIVANGKVVKRFSPLGKMKWESKLPVSNVTFYRDNLYGTSHSERNLYRLNLMDGKKLEEKYLAFQDPHGIVYNSQGFLYITSGEQNEVYQKKNDKSTFTMWLYDAMKKCGSRAQVICPLYITVDPDDNILVTSHYGGHVYKFDQDGDFVWNSRVSEGCCEPCGVVTDHRGHVFVAAYAKHKIYHVAPDGKIIRKIGSKEDGISYPRAVAIWSKKKQLIVGQKNKILIYQM